MEGTYMAVINRKACWLRKKDITTELGVSRGTADKLYKGVQFGIEIGRYNRYCIADNFVNFYAVVDFLKYGDQMKDKNLRKYLPAFSPDEVAETCGYNMRRVEGEKYVDSSNYSHHEHGDRVPDGCRGNGCLWRQ